MHRSQPTRRACWKSTSFFLQKHQFVSEASASSSAKSFVPLMIIVIIVIDVIDVVDVVDATVVVVVVVVVIVVVVVVAVAAAAAVLLLIARVPSPLPNVLLLGRARKNTDKDNKRSCCFSKTHFDSQRFEAFWSFSHQTTQYLRLFFHFGFGCSKDAICSVYLRILFRVSLHAALKLPSDGRNSEEICLKMHGKPHCK